LGACCPLGHILAEGSSGPDRALTGRQPLSTVVISEQVVEWPWLQSPSFSSRTTGTWWTKVKIKAPLAIALALALGCLGQTLFSRPGPAVDGIIVFTLGTLCLLVIPPRRDEPSPDHTGEAALGMANVVLMGIGIFLVLLCLGDLYLHKSSTPALVLWIAGAALFVPGVSIGAIRPELRLERREILALGLIMILALFMRTYRLADMPPALYLDEADNGIWGLRFVEEPYSPFTEQRHGNATMPFQLLGIALKIFGVETSVLRGFDVFIGLLTVAAFYFLAREIFDVTPALIGTAFLAISRWHVHFSRVAFVDNLQVPLFEILALLFIWRGLRRGSRLDYALAGLSFGLGFHTYIGYRVFPLILGVYLLHLYVSKRGLIRSQRRGLVVFALATFIAVSPLALYAIQRPEIFVRRAEAASVLQDIVEDGSYRPLLENASKSLLMYNQRGDPRPRHNLPDEPMLDGITAVLFGLGLGYSVLRWRHDGYFLLAAWLLLGLLPGILSLADSNPHSLRTLGNVPPVFLLVTAFWDRAWSTYEPFFRGRSRRYLCAAVALLVLISLGTNSFTYFHRQASNESVYYDFDPAQTAAGQLVRERGKDILVLVSHELTNHSDLKLIPYGVPFAVLDLNTHVPVRGTVNQGVIYVLEWSHAQLIPRLKALYPQGEYVEHMDRYGRTMFYTYEVSQEQLTSAQGLTAEYFKGLDFEEPVALERVERHVELSAGESPVDAPFSVLWHGSLYVPEYEPYTFIVESTGWASLRVGQTLELEVDGGLRTASAHLPAGFHLIEVEAVRRQPGLLRLSWVRPDDTEEVIPGDFLYVQELYRSGLLGMYRQGIGWEGEPEVVHSDSFIAPNDVLPSPFSIEWIGKIYLPLSGTYTFGTISDDGSYLYLDDQLVVDNGGHHGDVYIEGQMTLEEGFHDLRLRYFQDGGGRKIELFWTPPGGARTQVPQEQLFPPDSDLIPPPSSASPAAASTPSAPIHELGGAAFADAWGARGDGWGQFNEPRGIAVGLEGTVYVADSGNGRIQAFDSGSGFLREFGSDIVGAPCDLAVSRDGRVYVVDVELDSIFVFSPQGDLEERWGEGWALFDPRGVDVDSLGNLYVANTGANVVLKVSPQGELLHSFDGGGLGQTNLNQPTDVAVDDQGNLHVVDTENRRVQVFDAMGRHLREWPISAANTADGPHIVAGLDGLLYLTDPEMSKVLVYDPYGRLVSSWGERGSLEGQLSKPIGIGFDQRTSVYVADTYNHRIQVYTITR
jgi:sugar lactone lactonase YvrE